MNETLDRPGLALQGPVAVQSTEDTMASATIKDAESVAAQRRCEMIAVAAYYRSLHRGSQAGFELEDWLDAEKEIDRRLAA